MSSERTETSISFESSLPFLDPFYGRSLPTRPPWVYKGRVLAAPLFPSVRTPNLTGRTSTDSWDLQHRIQSYSREPHPLRLIKDSLFFCPFVQNPDSSVFTDSPIKWTELERLFIPSTGEHSRRRTGQSTTEDPCAYKTGGVSRRIVGVTDDSSLHGGLARHRRDGERGSNSEKGSWCRNLCRIRDCSLGRP